MNSDDERFTSPLYDDSVFSSATKETKDKKEDDTKEDHMKEKETKEKVSAMVFFFFLFQYTHHVLATAG